MAQCDPSSGACVHLAIGAREVTRDAYASFVAASNKPALPLVCTAKSAFEPDSACMKTVQPCPDADPDCGTQPQVCVDWCDAYAYCAWSGKRLCGKLGGGPITFDQFANPGKSEWMNGCSSGGQHAYPYGDDENNAACNGSIYANANHVATVVVGSVAACQSAVPGYAGIFDMSGNAAEWEDACEKIATDANASMSDKCRVRGGSYQSENAALACAADRFLLRNQPSPDVGFRCCGM
jgi:formylglycine-generating enzyme required for sulfatase activity